MTRPRTANPAQPLVLVADDPLAGEPAIVGGKAASLARARRGGLPVPDWISVSTACWEDLYERACARIERVLAEADLSGPAGLEAASRQCREAFAAQGLPESVTLALSQALNRLSGARFAVRSSGVGEDSARASFAGQHDSFLNVSAAEVPARVLECMSSAFTARALAYRARRGLALEHSRCAVVVQAMIDAASAGVLFTADPTSGATEQLVVSAAPGLGEGVVAGTVECDQFRVERSSGTVVERRVARKRLQVVASAGGGTVHAEVPDDAARRPSVHDEQMRELARLALRAERLFAVPVDVEWAIDREGRCWLLQARPITATAQGLRSLFDNANIVENYPGLTLPLTYSFVRRGYEVVFREAVLALGIPVELVETRAAALSNLVALVDGRLYYNLGNWYALYRLVPGFESLIPAFERGLGVATSEGGGGRGEGARGLERARLGRDFLRVAARLVAEWRRGRTKADAFVARVEAERVALDGLQLDTLDTHALLARIERIEAALRGPYHVSVLNDLYAQQFHALLVRMLARWRLGDEALVHRLLAGERLASVEPLRSLLDVARAILANQELTRLFDSDQPGHVVWHELHRNPGWREIAALVARHFASFGDRTLEELKLETPRPQERPAIAVELLRGALASVRRGQPIANGEESARREAEKLLRERAGAAGLRARALQPLVAGLRSSVAMRELLRLARSRGYGLIRRLYLELASRLVDAQLLATVDDIFYLGEEEIAAAVRGGAIDTELQAVVERRRAAYARFAAAEPPPPRFETYGLVHGARRRLAEPAAQAATGAEGDRLVGTGCGGGRVRARARVVESAGGAPRGTQGRALVAATTDPGWVYLMVDAAALVSERGSVLSHTAIIGRELGVPTVVGVEGAVTRIADGVEIEVDGASGVVRLIGSPADQRSRE